MVPTPTRATPAREGVRGHCCPGGHGNAGQRGLPQNLHTSRSGCLGGEGRSHGGVTQEKGPWGPSVHLWARPCRAPTAVADGPQARVRAAETERETERELDDTAGKKDHLTTPTEPRGAGLGRDRLPTALFLALAQAGPASAEQPGEAETGTGKAHDQEA